MGKGWTLETLEIHFSEKLAALHMLMDQRQRDTDRALDVALQSMNRRLESMNEFREALSDQRLSDERNRSKVQEQYVAKEIYDLEHGALEKLIGKNSDHIVEMDKKLFALSELKVDKREGLSSKYMYSAILFAALSFIGSIIGIFWNFANHH